MSTDIRESASDRTAREEQRTFNDFLQTPTTRRQFLRQAGIAGLSVPTVGAVVVACAPAATTRRLTNSASPAAAKAVTGGTVTFARYADADNLDPYFTVEDEGISIDLQIYDRLLQMSSDGQSVEPSLASSWKFSNGNKILTLKLLDGLKFSDGTPVTAADVAFCLNRTFDPNSNFGFLFGPVSTNWPAAGGSASAIDTTTVQIELSAPFAPLLPALTTFAASIYPMANYQKWGAASMSQHPVGTGAYVLSSWNPGVQLVLVPNPYYRTAGKPYIKKLVFNVVQSDNARVLQLEDKAVTLIDRVPASTIGSMKAGGNETIQVPGTELMFVRFNYRKAPYKDVNVRRAMSWAADRAKMAKDIYFGYGYPAKSLVLPSCIDYSGVGAPSFDLAKAKKYLQASSRPHGFKDTLLYEGSDSSYQSAMEIWATDLKKIGIDLTLVPTESAQLGSITQGASWHIAGLYFTPDTPSPDEILGFADYAEINAIHTYFHDEKLHRMIVAARQELNPTAARTQYLAIQKRINELCVTVNFIVQPTLYEARPSLRNFHPSAEGEYYFEDAFLVG